MAKKKDYQALCPLFGWLPTDTIKHTFEATTQYACIPMSTILKKHFQSPNPALNVPHRNEPVATDTVYSDTPAIDSGVTTAQFFVGCDSMVCDVYGIKSDWQFVNTLEDNIRQRGAPTKLISDHAQVEISEKSKTSYAPSLLVVGKVNHTSNIKTQLNAISRPSRLLPTPSLTAPAHLPVPGYYAFFISASS